MNTARYEISEQDYVNVGALHARLTPRAWVVLVLAIAVCAAIALWGPSARLRGMALAGMVGGVAGGLLVRWVLTPWQLRRNYRRYPAIREALTVTLTADGVRFDAAGGHSELPWARIYRWRRGADYVLIYLMPRLFHPVPRRLAAQGFDVAALEGALARHVGPTR